MKLTLLHRDDDLLVVAKPSGIATTAPDRRDSLARRVEALDRHAPRHHPSSRLDTDVTGVVVFARTDRGIARVLRAREEGRYARRYVALARAPADPSPEIGSDAPALYTWDIAIDPRDPRRRRALEPGSDPNALRVQAARTRAWVLSRSASASALLLEPITGRTHQLRVHAARAGTPLLGDVAYGGPRRLVAPDGSVIACPRVALHCLVVVLPGSAGEPLSFVAPLPDDLLTLARGVGLLPIDVAMIEREARASLSR